MREELISLLEEAFEAGIITSTVQSQIDAIKKNIKLSDAEYHQIEDQIRLDAYVKKVKEREKKGITFMGDLRKQYKITEDDKVIVQKMLRSDPQKKQEAPPKTEPPKQHEQMPEEAAPKRPEPVKKQEPPKKPEPQKQAEPGKKQETSSQSDVMKRSEMLKQHAQMPSTETAKKTEPAKKQEPPQKPEPPKKQETFQPAEQTKYPSGETPLILVADDNEIQLFLMKKLVEENGLTCVTTDSPEAAVRIITEKKPAIVFCDVNFGIGKPTGMDVFTNIRTKNIQVPFVLVSAFFQKEFRDHAKRIGINDYLTKPVDQDHLTATIKKYLSR